MKDQLYKLNDYIRVQNQENASHHVGIITTNSRVSKRGYSINTYELRIAPIDRSLKHRKRNDNIHPQLIARTSGTYKPSWMVELSGYYLEKSLDEIIKILVNKLNL